MGFWNIFRRKKEEKINENIQTIEVPTEILESGRVASEESYKQEEKEGFVEKIPESFKPAENVKQEENDKSLITEWVKQINQSLLEIKEKLENSFNLNVVQQPILEKLDSISKQLPDQIAQPVLRKIEETRLPIEKVIDEVKKAVSEELSKDKLNKPIIAQKLEKRIDEVASSLIPKHILDLLFKTESMTFTELLEATGTTRPTLARYLDSLLKSGKIEKARIGKYTYYRIPAIQIKTPTSQVNSS